jgi:hypothetical protein
MGWWSPHLVHSARRPFILGLWYLPRVFVRMENLVEWIGRGNRSTRRKPAPAPLCPLQIPLDQTRARTLAAAGGSQRLTAWAMARPKIPYLLHQPPSHPPPTPRSILFAVSSTLFFGHSEISRWINFCRIPPYLEMMLNRTVHLVLLDLPHKKTI